MPVCNKCRKFSECAATDFCQHCGAKDWIAESGFRRFFRVAKKDAKNFFATTQKTAEEEVFQPIIGCVGVVLWAVVVIGLLLGGLWLLVALVKFMWQHS